jgi:hypothetical protein
VWGKKILGGTKGKSEGYPEKRKTETVFEKVATARRRFFSKKGTMPIYTDRDQAENYYRKNIQFKEARRKKK